MAHHGPDPLLDGEDHEAQAKLRKELLKNTHLLESLGATGKYPQGKITPSDEGELQFAVGIRDGKVVIEFGKPTKWLGMDRHQARQLGEILIARSEQCLMIKRPGKTTAKADAG